MTERTFGYPGGCLGWYKNDQGISWPLWPNSTINYWWHTSSVNEEDYDFY